VLAQRLALAIHMLQAQEQERQVRRRQGAAVGEGQSQALQSAGYAEPGLHHQAFQEAESTGYGAYRPVVGPHFESLAAQAMERVFGPGGMPTAQGALYSAQFPGTTGIPTTTVGRTGFPLGCSLQVGGAVTGVGTPLYLFGGPGHGGRHQEEPPESGGKAAQERHGEWYCVSGCWYPFLVGRSPLSKVVESCGATVLNTDRHCTVQYSHPF